jgi:hypothetical protein
MEEWVFIYFIRKRKKLAAVGQIQERPARRAHFVAALELGQLYDTKTFKHLAASLVLWCCGLGTSFFFFFFFLKKITRQKLSHLDDELAGGI